MKHATTRMIFAYWDALRGERAAPERGEIEPGEIRHALADTFILELGPEGHAEFRLAGTRLCALFGHELRGRAFTGLWRETGRTEAARDLDVVVSESTGLVAGLAGTSQEGAELDLELILLPLRHRGRPSARALGAISPAFVPSWIGFDHLKGLTTTSRRVIWPSQIGHGDFAGNPTPQERRRRFVVHTGGKSLAG